MVVGLWEQLPLRTLERALLDHKIVVQEDIKVLDKASVPIIKLTDKNSQVKVSSSEFELISLSIRILHSPLCFVVRLTLASTWPMGCARQSL